MSRVLVVDDDLGIRELLRTILELEGFEVELASCGAQALSVLTQARDPLIVLMDVMMPGLTGIEVCARLAASGAAGERHRVALMTAGLLADEDCPPPARTILRKPFDLDDVVDLVAQLARDLAHALMGETAEAANASHGLRVSTPSPVAAAC